MQFDNSNNNNYTWCCGQGRARQAAPAILRKVAIAYPPAEMLKECMEEEEGVAAAEEEEVVVKAEEEEERSSIEDLTRAHSVRIPTNNICIFKI